MAIHYTDPGISHNKKQLYHLWHFNAEQLTYISEEETSDKLLAGTTFYHRFFLNMLIGIFDVFFFPLFHSFFHFNISSVLKSAQLFTGLK